ncbi:MAG TPA: adenine phosphoribosyltransferase [Gemmatimonadaceae bacterium]|nr:adenine phosphoribosyltransferase [Gemmatimonadaceae bacterium]
MSASATNLAADLRRAIRDVPDFPKPGILFKDITGVLADHALFARAVHAMAAPFAGDHVTYVAGIESRGFILGAPVALAMGAGFIPLRKPGKLPSAVERVEYALEYGTDALEVLHGALRAGHRVLIVDDVLATGGTARAACDLVNATGAHVVGCSFLLELTALAGLAKLTGVRSHALLAV